MSSEEVDLIWQYNKKVETTYRDAIKALIPDIEDILSTEDKEAYKDIFKAIKDTTVSYVKGEMSHSRYMGEMQLLTRAVRARSTADTLDSSRATRSAFVTALEILVKVIGTRLMP